MFCPRMITTKALICFCKTVHLILVKFITLFLGLNGAAFKSVIYSRLERPLSQSKVTFPQLLILTESYV